MATASLNGAEIFYEERGSGVPCVVMHGGLGYDHTYMKTTLTPLEDRLRLVYYDHRGNGRSERVPLETITMPQLAEDADALRAELGLDRVAVLGHSYGGFVALEYAKRFPDRLTHLVLLDTSPAPREPFEPTPDELAENADPSWITDDVRAAAAAMAMPSTDKELATIVPKIAPVYLKDSSPDELARLLGACVLDAAAMVQGMKALQGWSVVDALGEITCPTLVISGRYDLMMRPESSKRLSNAIPGAELVWFEHSGHFPWLEESAAFFDVVKDFFARHP